MYINGDVEQAAHLSAPTFIAYPRSVVAVEGQNVSLDCAANGNPNPTITWLKDGSAIDLKYAEFLPFLVVFMFFRKFTDIWTVSTVW